jgi:hypothetical protein
MGGDGQAKLQPLRVSGRRRKKADRDVSGEQQNEAAGDHERDLRRQMQKGTDLSRCHNSACCHHRGDAQPQGQAVERDDTGNLACTQTPGAVEPVADRTSGQQGQAHGVAEGIANEAGERALPQRQRLGDVAQGQRIVEC